MSRARHLRVQRRRTIFKDAAAAARRQGLSFLQANSVGPTTAALFSQEVAEFQQWVETNQLETDDAKLVDQHLLALLDEMYFDGHNHEKGERLLVGHAFLNPDMRKGATATQAMRAWL